MLKSLAIAAFAAAWLPGLPAAEEFTGTIEIFEYSLFRSVNGEVYTPRIEGEGAQRLFADKFRDLDKSEPICFLVAFTGELSAEHDFVERRIVRIQTWRDLDLVPCRS